MLGQLSLQPYKSFVIEHRNVATNASKSASQPPELNQFERVLQKAAVKVRLAHPAYPPPKQEILSESSHSLPKAKPQPSSKRTTNPTKSAHTKRHHLEQSPATGIDDDALLSGITDRERDSVWDAIRLEVEGASGSAVGDWDGDDLGPSTSAQAKRRAAPANAREDGGSSSEPVASTSGFKGFGASPRRPNPAPQPTSASVATSKAPSPSTSSASPPAHSRRETQQTQPERGSGPVRVFLFNTEEALTKSLLEQLGLAGRVEVVSELRGADLILAAKLARSGKHVNLTQGERTAANARIPFVVVGRNMTADNLRAALEPLLHLSPEEAAALVAERAAAKRGPSAAELQAHRLAMAEGLGDLLRSGRG